MSDDAISEKIKAFLKCDKHMELISSDNPAIQKRRLYQPPLCSVFREPVTRMINIDHHTFDIDKEAANQLPNIINNRVGKIVPVEDTSPQILENYQKKRNIGIVFSGGPAPGGHNVIAGLYDAAKKANPESRIFGFLVGPDGIIENDHVELTDDVVDQYRNLGGFTMIRTGRAKIDTPKKVWQARQTCRHLDLSALVIVGGDDSNTNAAFLANEMFNDGIQVIGVPKTIDGDIQVRTVDGEMLCAISFGFHSAAMAFSHSVSNLCSDCSSDVKYWHVCKVMGRVASHLALEVGLQTHANLTLIGEDLADYMDLSRIEQAKEKGDIDYTAYGMTLRHLSRVICDAIVRRARVGKNYGVIVIPEGVLEFINEIQVFIIKLNTIIADYNRTHDRDFHSSFPMLNDKLDYLRRLLRDIRKDVSFGIWNARDDELFNDIPGFFQEGLLTERDSHGNFQFSQVQTDILLIELVKDYLNILKEKGIYKLGVHVSYFKKMLKKNGLDPDYYGPILFNNYGTSDHLLLKENIISLKTLKQELSKGDDGKMVEEIPKPIDEIYKKSIPELKIQPHFYGYDGRGTDPTRFDCDYTYNLGFCVFSLIASGSTGQMAAIKNLEREFSDWEPIGIPIAPLMHLEERKGKLSLVLERSLVDIKSLAFNILKVHRDKWLCDVSGKDQYRKPGPIDLDGLDNREKPLSLYLNAFDMK